jgi:Domain of unknown function (DUF4430)
LERRKNVKKSTLIAAVLALAFIGVGGYALNSVNNSPKTQSSPTVSVTAKATEAPKITVSEDKKVVTYMGVKDETALVTGKALTAVETKSTTYGDMVIGINGLKADESSEFWAFYVDGAQASGGAGTYKAKGGEKIEWKLEKF